MVARQRGLIRPQDIETLVSNHQRQRPVQGTKAEIDFMPVVLLRLPATDCWWMLTELDTDGVAFGLCQIFVAELGSVWLPELEELDFHGLRVQQDLSWQPRMTLSQYARLPRRDMKIMCL